MQCITHFLQLPIEDQFLNDMECSRSGLFVPQEDGSAPGMVRWPLIFPSLDRHLRFAINLPLPISWILPSGHASHASFLS